MVKKYLLFFGLCLLTIVSLQSITINTPIYTFVLEHGLEIKSDLKEFFPLKTDDEKHEMTFQDLRKNLNYFQKQLAKSHTGWKYSQDYASAKMALGIYLNILKAFDTWKKQNGRQFPLFKQDKNSQWIVFETEKSFTDFINYCERKKIIIRECGDQEDYVLNDLLGLLYQIKKEINQ